MRHFVLTRSAYGPDWSLEANRRRLAITRAVTATLMLQQTNRDWTWVVLFDERDPLLEEREAVFRESAPAFTPILWQPTEIAAAPWDPGAHRTNVIQRIAATAYRGPWVNALGDRDELTLTTRIDDDDGFSPTALARIAAAARGCDARTILMQPIGYRVWQGRASRVEHGTNAMHTLATPAGDRMTVYDYGHRRAEEVAPIVTVDRRPAWLWVRHQDTISGWRKADSPIDDRVRQLFPIDWATIA